MGAFTGTKRLVRLALRRDRIVLPVSALLILLMSAGSAPALSSAYPDQEKILTYITSSVPSVAGRVFQGTVQGPTLGSILMAEVYIFTAVLLAIISVFIISRHTRHNEETGASELIGSTVVGRNAQLAAAGIVAVGFNALLGILFFAIIAALPEFSAMGSAFFALSLAGVGIFFSAVSMLTVQLSDHRRGANLLAIGLVILSFVIRGVGDALGNIGPNGLSVEAHWLTWLSPIGLGYQVLPFAENRIIPLILLLAFSATLTLFAFKLMRKRDNGSSIFPSKAGPKSAGKKLLRPLGLVSRIHRTNLLAWTAGFAVSGGMIAVIVDDFKSTFEENEAFQEFLSASGAGGGDIIDTLLATMIPLLAAMLAGYVVTALSKMQDEESSGRIEFLLSTALGRIKWLASHIVFTILGIFISLGSMGVAGALGYMIATGSSNTAMNFMLAAFVSVPAMLLFMSIIVLVYAIFGRFTKSLAWIFYGYCALIGSLAGIFSLPDWINNASPFFHTPLYPSSSFNAQPLIIMVALSLVILTLAAVAFRNRDISLQ